MDIEVRKTINGDRETIKSILFDTRVFNQEEIDCAMELVDIYLNNLLQGDYLIASALVTTISYPEDGNGKRVGGYQDSRSEVAGYVCYGKVPLTKGVYDLYWIAVRQGYQGCGIGRILLKYVEDEIGKLSARMLLAETSSRAVYEKTRRFYIKNGFSEEAKVKDFYSQGDDKIIYKKIIIL
ncbi:MAG: GNAT family N-acetyltransferase [Nitrospinae bacterium]|nr:GNAT family N-acetyltransferase [Nitrospinota bacterium]